MYLVLSMNISSVASFCKIIRRSRYTCKNLAMHIGVIPAKVSDCVCQLILVCYMRNRLAITRVSVDVAGDLMCMRNSSIQNAHHYNYAYTCECWMHT